MNSLSRFAVILALIFSTYVGAYAEDHSPVPVKIDTRSSVLDHHTSVARIENPTDTDLTVTILMERPKSGAHKRLSLIIAMHNFKEVGASQGWKLFPGDRITVTSDGYAPLTQQL